MIRRNLYSTILAPIINIQTALSNTLNEKLTYVLVHGAWHGGWCWKLVRDELKKSGHTVFSPSLTGLGDRVHLRNPSINLTTHVNDIVNLIKHEELEDIILVGHSYAGHVVSCVADKISNKIRHIMYLDAVLPTNGSAFLKPGIGEERSKTAKEGYLLAKPDMSFLGLTKEHELHDWVETHLVEHLLPTLMETVNYKNNGPAKIKKTFVRCLQNPRTRNKRSDPVEQLIAQGPLWQYLTIDTGHNLMVTEPKATAQILMKYV